METYNNYHELTDTIAEIDRRIARATDDKLADQGKDGLGRAWLQREIDVLASLRTWMTEQMAGGALVQPPAMGDPYRRIDQP